MRSFRLAVLVLSMVALAVGSAFADKQAELDAFALKPWVLSTLPPLAIMADVWETEPNDTCPGEAYTMGDAFHGAIDPGGDMDWITFSGTAGEALTIGTDEDPGLPTVDTVIELYSDDCTTLLTSDDDGGPGLYSLIQNFELPYTGDYNLKIRGFSSFSSGNYIALGALTVPQQPGFCPVGTYKAIKRNVNQEIPDNDPAGLDCPTIEFWELPGMVVMDVIVDLNIEHTWVGDLIFTLCHTSDLGVVTCVELVSRPPCSGDLVADPEDKYYFSSRPDLAPLGVLECPPVLPAACYGSIDDLTIFNGMDFGDGYWDLNISDNAGADIGFVYNWSLHILADAPVSVEDASWGAIKATYR